MPRPALRRVCLLIVAGVLLSACGPASAGISVGGHLGQRIELSATHVGAGQSISGSLVIVNPGPPVNISHGCRPGFVVVLTNSQFPPQVVWPADCHAGPFTIPAGTSRLPVTVATTYPECAQAGSGTASAPPCLGGHTMPPLPPGTYQAVAVWSGTVTLAPAKPVTVTLVAAS